MSKFGWCFGPEGSTGDHGACPHEIGAGDTILRCGCACHEREPVPLSECVAEIREQIEVREG